MTSETPAPRTNRPDLADPATMIVRDREDYLGGNAPDIGRRIADDQVELFVGGEPAFSLQQQFQRVAPEYMALHDVGTSATLRLLGALAAAAGARVQRLSIRRQGQGVALAVIQFVEVPQVGRPSLRLYSTDIQADGSVRQQLAQVLLSNSRLGVLMVGELPPAQLTTLLQPLRDGIARAAWPNRELLMLPLGSATTLAAQAAQLSGNSGVTVRVTPQAARPHDAWAYISGVWNRLNNDADRALQTDIRRALPKPAVPRPEAPTQPMGLAPAAAEPPAPAGENLASWADFARRCAGVKGVTACCVFELASKRPLAHTGDLPAERLAEQGRGMLDALAVGTRALGFGQQVPEAAVTVGEQHLLLKPVKGHEGIVVHLVLHASAANLTLARMQLERVAPPQ